MVGLSRQIWRKGAEVMHVMDRAGNTQGGHEKLHAWFELAKLAQEC
jgi:hypothetical protein